LAASFSAASLSRLLKVVDALDGLRGPAHDGLPMADIQTLAGSLVLERALKLGLDCGDDPAFISFDAKRRGDHQGLKQAA
jgi:hypothetical protein